MLPQKGKQAQKLKAPWQQNRWKSLLTERDSGETIGAGQRRSVLVRELHSCLTFDHVHIIGPVPNGQGDGLLVLLHQFHHHGLLLGRHAAADHCPALTGQIHKVLLLLLLVGLCPSPFLRLLFLLFCCSGEF